LRKIKVLDELKELNDKIQNEELFTAIDKKFYVEKESRTITDKLDKLSEKQDHYPMTKEKQTGKARRY
jgi:uncharacterized protein (DUF1697 family)